MGILQYTLLHSYLPASQSSASVSSCASSVSCPAMSARPQNLDKDIEQAISSTVSPTQASVLRDGDPFHRRNTNIQSVNSTDNDTSVDPLAVSVRSGNIPTELQLENSSRPTKPATAVASKVAPSKQAPDPKLLHPILLKVPLHIRFGFNGLLSNVLFMLAYNYAVLMFEHKVAVSTIYSIVYFIFIPLGHAFVSILVFGWPEYYIQSLMSNFPIGLTAIALGGVLTGYLDSIHFSDKVDDYIRNNLTFSKMPPRVLEDETDDESQFWSSLLVLIVTSIWTYVLSIYVNSAPTKSDKKEL